MSPLPGPQYRGTLAALLDVRQCSAEGCESILQVISPTLVERSLHHRLYANIASNSTLLGDQDVAASWNLPKFMGGRGNASASVSIVDRFSAAVLRTAIAELSFESSDECIPLAPFAYEGLLFKSQRLLVATSLVIDHGADPSEWPLTIFDATLRRNWDLAADKRLLETNAEQIILQFLLPSVGEAPSETTSSILHQDKL